MVTRAKIWAKIEKKMVERSWKFFFLNRIEKKEMDKPVRLCHLDMKPAT